MSRETSTDLEKLFRAGQFATIIQNVGGSKDVMGRLEPRDRLLVAHASLYAGSTDTAANVANACSVESMSPGQRSRSELILGLIEKRRGNLGTAISRLQHAVRLAQEGADHEQAAWAQLQLFRLLAEGHPPQILGGILAESRRIVSKAGHPHLTAFLHDCVALMEGQTGHLTEARRHCDIERSILERYPNAWLEQLMHVNASCIAILNCDFAEGIAHSDAARQLKDLVGEGNWKYVIALNDAHVQLITGRFAKALAHFEEIRKGDRTLSRIAALDGIARIHLALNRLDDCEATVNEVIHARGERALSSFYVARWIGFTKAKLLIRRSMYTEAVQHCDMELERARACADFPLTAALSYLRAEALANAGDFRGSGNALLSTAMLDVGAIREVVGNYYDACYQALAKTQSPLAPALNARAQRVWRIEGNVCAQVESESRSGPPRTVRDMKESSRETPTLSGISQFDPRNTAAFVIGCVAAAFDAALDPRMVCAELIQMATAAECADKLKIVERRISTRSPQASQASDPDSVVLQGDMSRRIDLSVSAPIDEVSQAVVLGDILRIGRAVSSLASARRETRNRAALWPAHEAESDDLLFVSEEMSALKSTAKKIAPTNVPVLITGETGTGKEILARAIHAASTRAGATFLPFNCCAGPKDMMDAQLFGHRRGAFTGATEHAPGVIRAASGGTLFLDEIGESALDVQPKLLRFLESGEIHPIGESHPVRVDVRVIAATNIDLDAAVSTGRFREDLFYRLNIVRLHLPPLRERRVEIPVFAQHYLEKYARELQKGDLRLAEETMEYLLLYRWPGNVRQLANEMRRLAALAETDAVLMPEHLSPDILASRRTVPPSERVLEANEVVVRLDQPMAAATEHLERAMLQHALKACNGRMEDTARLLGLSRKGLYLKRVRFGLEPPETHARTA